jgi:hypothetical protein
VWYARARDDPVAGPPVPGVDPLVMAHLHPEQVPLVLGPPNRHDQLLALLLQHAFDAAEGFEAVKAERYDGWLPEGGFKRSPMATDTNASDTSRGNTRRT